MIEIAVTVNGVRHERRVEPRLLLSDFIRHELGLYGTHVGCEHGVCGACTVLLEGRPARSCLTLAVQADGAEIQTVESLAQGLEAARRPSRRRPAGRAAAPSPPPGTPRSIRCSRRSTSTSACNAGSARRGS